MIALLCAPLAHAAPTSIEPVGSRIPVWSTEYEAVVWLPYAPPGTETQATLLLADFDTSAPITTGKASLSLAGPGNVQVQIQPGPMPGIWPFHRR